MSVYIRLTTPPQNTCRVVGVSPAPSTEFSGRCRIHRLGFVDPDSPAGTLARWWVSVRFPVRDRLSRLLLLLFLLVFSLLLFSLLSSLSLEHLQGGGCVSDDPLTNVSPRTQNTCRVVGVTRPIPSALPPPEHLQGGVRVDSYRRRTTRRRADRRRERQTDWENDGTTDRRTKVVRQPWSNNWLSDGRAVRCLKTEVSAPRSGSGTLARWCVRIEPDLSPRLTPGTLADRCVPAGSRPASWRTDRPQPGS